MKASKRKKRLAMLAACALVMPWGMNAASAANPEYPANDGSGTQPQHIGSGFGASSHIYTDGSGNSNNGNANIDRYLVQSTGAAADTRIDFTGRQTLTSGNNSASAITTTADKFYSDKTYGLYNNSGKLSWYGSGTGDALNITTNAYQATAYGIYNDGGNFTTADRDTGTDRAAGSGIDITAAANSKIDDDPENNNTYSTLPSQTPFQEAAGIWADNSAVNNIKAKSVNASTTEDMTIYKEQSQIYLQHQAQFDTLNKNIDNAAENYADILRDYASYAGNSEYQEDLSRAQSAVDSAILAYKNAAAQERAIGIGADNGAANTVDASGNITAGYAVTMNYGKYDYPTPDPIAGNLSYSDTAAAVYADNAAHNTVKANAIKSTGSTNETSYMNGTADHIINIRDVTGVYADNNAQNTVTVSGTDGTDYSIIVSDSGQFQKNKYVTGGISAVSDDLYKHLAGVYANNGAVNDITSAGGIEADLGDYYNQLSTTGNIVSDTSFNFLGNSSLHINAVEADNNAKNIVTAKDIMASMGDSTPSNRGYTSVEDQYNWQNDANPVNKLTSTKVNAITVDLRGISSDHGASTQADVHDIDVRAGVISGSIGDSSTIAKTTSQSQLPVLNIERRFNEMINGAAVYGNNSAVNKVTAHDLSADVSVSGSISDNVNYQSNNTQTADKTVNMVFKMPTTMTGIYGNNYAQNYVKADNISANANLQSIYIMYSPEQVSAATTYTYCMPLTAQGVYGEHGAVNAVDANSIRATAWSDKEIQNYDDSTHHDTNVDKLSNNSNMVFQAAGAYAESGALNDVTVKDIKAAAYLPSQEKNYNDASGEPRPVTNFLNTISKAYGIYGDSNSVTNLHGQDASGINIAVGVAQNSSNVNNTNDYTYNITENQKKHTSNVQAYGMYMDNAAVNIYDNVKVKAFDLSASTHPSGFELLDHPETYLNNASVNFAGYKDYYDPYYFNVTAASDDPEKSIAGSYAFHTYDSTADGGRLNLQGENTLTVNTDLMSQAAGSSNNADWMRFSSLDRRSTGTTDIAVAYDKSVPKDARGILTGYKAIVLQIENGSAITAGNQKFTTSDGADAAFTGKTLVTEDALRKYRLTPIVATENDSTDSNARDVVITALKYDTAAPSTGMKVSSDSLTAMRNAGLLLDMENSALMQRLGELRSFGKPNDDNVWVKFSKGQLGVGSIEGGAFTQKYNQVYVGYDRQLDLFSGGKFYAGGAISHLTGDVDYENGSGNAKGTGFSLYGTWLGNKGHYLDIVAKAERLNNDFNVRDLSGNNIHADYHTPMYSLSTEYGYRQNYNNGFFVEPQAQLQIGRINGVSYSLSDGARVNQGTVNSAIGRIGILGGRTFANGSNAYVSASVLREFGSSGSLAGSYDDDSKTIETEEYGTWYELGVGANFKIKDNCNMYLDINKGFGGNVTKDWQMNLGARWSF